MHWYLTISDEQSDIERNIKSMSGKASLTL